MVLIPGVDIRVFGFRKIRVGLGKTRVGSEFGRTSSKFQLGIFGQLGHSGARVSSGKSEPLGHLGQLRAFGIPRMTQPDKSPFHSRPVRSAIFACSFLLIVTLPLRSTQKMFETGKCSKKTIEKSLELLGSSKISFFIN